MSAGPPTRGLVYDAEKERHDLVAAERQFHTFAFTAKNVDTVIALLLTSEQTLVLRALQHLDRFAMNYIGYYDLLYEHQFLPKLLPHLLVESRDVARFAWKLMSQMFGVVAALPDILCNDKVFSGAYKLFVKSDDEFLVEYCAIVINHFASALPPKLGAISNPTILNTIFKRISFTNDPDVKLHCIKMLALIASTPKGLGLICQDNLVDVLLDAVNDEYEANQMAALQALIALVKCEHINIVQSFEGPKLLERFFDILETEHMAHLHMTSFALLRELLKRPNVAKPFYRGMNIRRFMKFVNAHEECVGPAMDVLSELATYHDAQPILHELGLSEMLSKYHVEGNIEAAKNGTVAMASYPISMDTFVRDNSVKAIIDILKDDTKTDEAKKSAAKCLAEFISQSEPAGVQTVEADGMVHIAKLLSGEISMDLRWLLVNVLVSFAKYDYLKQMVMTEPMADGLNTTLMMAVSCYMFLTEVLDCVGLYLSEEPVQKMFVSDDMVAVLKQCMFDASATVPLVVRKGAVNLITKCAPYPVLTNKLIEQSVLQSLLDDGDAHENCPNWSCAIDTILDNNLSMKFANRGNVELHEKTTDEVFYTTPIIWTKPSVLYDIYQKELAPFQPVYTCNFDSPAELDETPDSSDYHGKTRPQDDRLIEYLRIAQETMAIYRVPTEITTLDHCRRCVELLSDLVCTKICSEPHESLASDETVNHSSNRHSSMTSSKDINELLDDLQHATYNNLQMLRLGEYDCNVFPIGVIRVGGYLEKSLLFKVLADRLGLPCSLRMNPDHNRMVWNEVSMPVEAPDDCCPVDGPTARHQPTHIVDLMHTPGNLYALGSARAHSYLGVGKLNKSDLSIE